MLVRGSGAGCGLADSLNQLTSGGGRGDLLSGVDVVPKHGGVRAGRVSGVPEDRNEGAAVSWPRRGNTTQRQQREKKQDGNLSKKLIAWAPVFPHLLLTECYPRYKKKGIATELPAVLRATSSYRREFCPLIPFCDYNIGPLIHRIVNKM